MSLQIFLDLDTFCQLPLEEKEDFANRKLIPQLMDFISDDRNIAGEADRMAKRSLINFFLSKIRPFGETSLNQMQELQNFVA